MDKKRHPASLIVRENPCMSFHFAAPVLKRAIHALTGLLQTGHMKNPKHRSELFGSAANVTDASGAFGVKQ